MQRTPWLLTLVAAVLCTISLPVKAAEWPKSLPVGGFNITDIKGSVNADGSGRASGKLKLPRTGDVPVDLTKNASGAVKVTSSQRITIGNITLEGSSEVNGSGLKGSGTVRVNSLTITGASFRLDSRGNLSGNGRLELGGVSVPATFQVAGSNLTVSGSTSRQTAVDTPLAHYTFKGQLLLVSQRGDVALNAVGSVERRGKVGNVLNNFGPMTKPVNLQNGQVNFSVAGVNVNFRMW